MLYKRIISILLTLALLVGMVPPTGADAAQTETALEPGQVTVEGTNALGDLLSEEIQASQQAALTAEEDYEAGYSITKLTFDGAVATVAYDAAEEATLLVAVYTEDGLTLLNSAYQTVKPEDTTVTVTLTGEMPAYFVAAAYLLNSYDLAPLCAGYRTTLYTRTIQDLKNSTVEDFDSERVLNLDGDTTTNFAVYGAGTLVVEAREGVNTVVSANDETKTYVIANADSQFTSLRPGDVVAYQYGAEEYLFLKVESIEVSGDTVTVYGGELELHDVFSHVKVEANGDLSSAEIDDSTADSGVLYSGRSVNTSSGAGTMDPKSSMSISPSSDSATAETKFEFILHEGAFDGKLSVGVKAEFTFLSVDETLYVEMVTENTLTIEATMEGKAEFKKDLGVWKIRMGLGAVSLVLKPQLKTEATVQGKITATIGKTIGFVSDSWYGFTPVESAPLLKLNVEAEGKIFFGLDLRPGVEVAEGWLLDMSAEFPFGFEVECKLAEVGMELSSEARHTCVICFELTPYAKIALTVKMKFLKSISADFQVLEWKRALQEAYCSIDHLEFGWGKCPYQDFRVVLYVRDSDGNPAGGAVFSVARDGVNILNDTVNSKGASTLYLPKGTYAIQASQGELQRSVTRTVKDACVVTITLPETADETPEEEPENPGSVLEDAEALPNTQPMRMTCSGWFRSNEAMRWATYISEDQAYSKIVITGTGEVTSTLWATGVGHKIKEDGTEDAALTMIYDWEINSFDEIVFGEGITSISDIYCGYTSDNPFAPGGLCVERVTLPSTLSEIGDGVFEGCAFTQITLPEGLSKIGSSAFSGCDNLRSIVIPGSVQTVGSNAFSGCDSLSQVVIGAGVTEIGDEAFQACPELRAIYLPDSVVTIGASAFAETGLAEIEIPTTVQSIGASAFYGCTSLKEVVILSDAENLGAHTFRGCTALNEVILTEGLKAIGESAFENCTALKTISIPKSVENIGKYAFREASSLETVVFAAFDLADGKEYSLCLGASAFEGCALVNVELPCIIEPQYPFVECDNIETIVIDGWLKGGYAFANNASTIYYPYTYSLAYYPGDGAENADLYYTVSVMMNQSPSAVWIPYTVDEGGNMVPMEDLSYCHRRDWGNHPFDDIVTAEAAGTAEPLPVETEPEVPEATEPAQTLPDETEPSQATDLTTVELPAAAANAFRISGNGATVRTLTSSAAAPVPMKPAALYGGDYSSEVTDGGTVRTASFSGLVPGGEYLMLVLSTLDTADPLNMDNLIHVDQAAASEDGTLSFDYVERQSFSTSYVMVSGPSNKHLRDADIIFPTVYASDGQQVIQPVVIYGGKILTEGKDYILSGQVDFSEAGTFTCCIRGIYEYTGTVRCDYTVAESPYGTVPPAEPLEHFALTQDYLLLGVDETAQLAAEVLPAELAADVTWSVEAGGEQIISVNKGTVTALAVGTAYVVATVTDGQNTISDRCRVDVSEALVIDGVQLSASKVTTELYKTDYATFDILLKLPQNYTTQAENAAAAENRGVAMESARFTDEAMAKFFDLVVLDDRTVQIVPTAEALDNPKSVKSSYKGTVTVTVAGKEYETEKLTLSVKKSSPKLKAKISAFNSFYTNQAQPIAITGATVTGITLDPSKTQPDWLNLEGGALVLNEKAGSKNSGKVNLLVDTEEWAIPAALTLTVKNTYKVPGVKLATTSVTVSNRPGTAEVALKLVPTNKVDTISGIGITGITVPDGYSVENFNEADGTFTLKAAEGFKAGRIDLKVNFGATTITLKLTVRTQAVKLKLSASKVSLNKTLGDVATVAVNCLTAGYDVTDPVLTFDAEKLNVSYADGKLTVSAKDAAYGKSYPVTIAAYEGAPAVKLNVAILKQNAAVKSTIKATGFIDVIRDGTAITVKPTYTNVLNVDVDNTAVLKIYSSADKFKNAIAEVKSEEGIFTIDKSVISDQTLKYKAQLETKFNENIVKSNMISLTVKMGAAKLTVKSEGTTLFAKDKNDRVEFSLATADAALNGITRVEFKNAKQAALLELIDYGNGTYAIGFKDGVVDKSLIGKSVTVPLNIFLEGNQTAKANATVNVKLTVVK